MSARQAKQARRSHVLPGEPIILPGRLTGSEFAAVAREVDELDTKGSEDELLPWEAARLAELIELLERSLRATQVAERGWRMIRGGKAVRS